MTTKEILLVLAGFTIAIHAVVVTTWGSWTEFRLSWREPKSALGLVRRELFEFSKFLSLGVLGAATIAFVFTFSTKIGFVLLTDPQIVHRDTIGAPSQSSYLKEMCALKSSCEQYAKVLKRCSIAGEIDRCIEINLADVYPMPNSRLCPITEELIPTRSQCLITRLANK
jgi:hypothetical protein